MKRWLKRIAIALGGIVGLILALVASLHRRRALIAAGDKRLDPDDGNAYRPDGGLRHAGASVSLMYGLSPRWSLIGFAGVDRLSDEAAASPLVRRREQFSGGMGLGYRL